MTEDAAIRAALWCGALAILIMVALLVVELWRDTRLGRWEKSAMTLFLGLVVAALGLVTCFA